MLLLLFPFLVLGNYNISRPVSNQDTISSGISIRDKRNEPKVTMYCRIPYRYCRALSFYPGSCENTTCKSEYTNHIHSDNEECKHRNKRAITFFLTDEIANDVLYQMNINVTYSNRYTITSECVVKVNEDCIITHKVGKCEWHNYQRVCTNGVDTDYNHRYC